MVTPESGENMKRIPVLNRWRKLQAVALGAVACLWGTAATAADPFPSKPITEIVPFSAGGPTDVIARITGEHMSKVLGQQIVIENVTGAGGTTGITRGAQAKADGYTIMMGHMGTHAAAPALYPKLKYYPE
jgi:tripartite-type tricarboxylate transporter receptor subunit TctC